MVISTQMCSVSPGPAEHLLSGDFVLIPNTPAYSDLKRFHDPKNLAFRASCNGVVPISSQPIKIRVIYSASTILLTDKQY
jgi:hypothetical protein